MIEISNLSFAYGQHPVIKNINFGLNRGELTCLLGPNGSGKTTIIKCLNGILKPDKGRIIFDGVPLSRLGQQQVARTISRVPQEHTSIFSYRCLEVVTMGITPHLRPGKQPAESVYEKARGLLSEMGIGELADRNYNNVSGGERQLVLIARALMQDTDYILMDEPTSHLDFKNQHSILERLVHLSHRGKGVLITLHDPNLALKYCDRVIILHQGQILAHGETGMVVTGDNLSRAYGVNIKVSQREQRVEIDPVKSALAAGDR